MEAKIRNGNLTIVLPVQDPKLSASGKNLVVASSRGVRQTTCRINGEIVSVIANAFIRPDVNGSEHTSVKERRSSATAQKYRRGQRKKRGKKAMGDQRPG
jgi:hypothetical protein